MFEREARGVSITPLSYLVTGVSLKSLVSLIYIKRRSHEHHARERRYIFVLEGGFSTTLRPLRLVRSCGVLDMFRNMHRSATFQQNDAESSVSTLSMYL